MNILASELDSVPANISIKTIWKWLPSVPNYRSGLEWKKEPEPLRHVSSWRYSHMDTDKPIDQPTYTWRHLLALISYIWQGLSQHIIWKYQRFVRIITARTLVDLFSFMNSGSTAMLMFATNHSWSTCQVHPPKLEEQLYLIAEGKWHTNHYKS